MTCRSNECIPQSSVQVATQELLRTLVYDTSLYNDETVKKVKSCLEMRADPNVKGSFFQRTALSWAVRKPSSSTCNGPYSSYALDIIKLLLEKRADMYIPDKDGIDALDYALRNNNEKIYELLNEKNFALIQYIAYSPKDKSDKPKDKIAEVEKFLKKGASVNARDFANQRAAVSWAIHAHKYKIATSLIQKKADLWQLDCNKKKPLDYANEEKAPQELITLIQAEMERTKPPAPKETKKTLFPDLNTSLSESTSSSH